MKIYRFFLLLPLLLWAGRSFSDCAEDLFFSKYIEGSGQNKALEIYNGTPEEINLENYQVETYYNGSSSPGYITGLSGTIGPGDVFILAHSGSDPYILIFTNQTIGFGWFNGNDAIILRKIPTNKIIDVIGEVGADPGANGWIVSDGSTTDHTLIRLSEVIAGVDSWETGSFQWKVYPINHFEGIGDHEMDCSVLDIFLNSFKGEVQEGKVYLSWLALNQNISSCMVEHSVDGNDFTAISENVYNCHLPGSVIHEFPVPGKNYYRMKILTDNNIVYSPVIAVDVIDFKLQVFPNPAVDFFTITFAVSEAIDVIVLNSAGLEIYKNILNGSGVMTFGEDFAPGVYLLLFNSKSINTQRRLVKL
ncbi:MAG: lamin tail domain-containing protein [Cytophagaceae bacterium]